VKAEAIRIKGKDGEVHIQPPIGSFDPMQTMCMSLDDYGQSYTPTNDKVSCDGCKQNMDTLKNGITLVKI
jgi:hypothetical protein